MRRRHEHGRAGRSEVIRMLEKERRQQLMFNPLIHLTQWWTVVTLVGWAMVLEAQPKQEKREEVEAGVEAGAETTTQQT